jgi:hypothetical protein
MHAPPQPPGGRTNRRVLVILAAVVLVGTFAGLLVWRLGGHTNTATPATTKPTTASPTMTSRPPGGVQPLAGRQFCGGGVRIYANADADMLRIAHALGGDSRAAGVFTQTKEEALAAYQRIFANQPSLLTLVRPEALPAEVLVLPATQVDLARFADQLRAQFPTAQTVDSTPRAPRCPASGEWPSSTPTG